MDQHKALALGGNFSKTDGLWKNRANLNTPGQQSGNVTATKSEEGDRSQDTLLSMERVVSTHS